MNPLSLIKRPLYMSLALAGRAFGVRHFRGLPNREGTLRVLMYHKISSVSPNSISVHPVAFEEQQDFLKEGYCVIGLDAVERHLDGEEVLPARAVLLTFDDGYLNNLEVAYPILKKYGHPAVLFPALDFLGGKTLPHDRHLKHVEPTLDWEGLRSLQDVFTIGSHACSHRSLTTLDFTTAAREIKLSKQILEERLGVEVKAFSYPKGSVGDFNQRLEDLVKEAGYRFAFTTLPGTNVPPLNRHRLRRHNVEDFGMRYFATLLDGSGDVLAVKDTRLGYAAKSGIRRLLKTQTG